MDFDEPVFQLYHESNEIIFFDWKEKTKLMHTFFIGEVLRLPGRASPERFGKIRKINKDFSLQLEVYESTNDRRGLTLEYPQVLLTLKCNEFNFANTEQDSRVIVLSKQDCKTQQFIDPDIFYYE